MRQSCDVHVVNSKAINILTKAITNPHCAIILYKAHTGIIDVLRVVLLASLMRLLQLPKVPLPIYAHHACLLFPCDDGEMQLCDAGTIHHQRTKMFTDRMDKPCVKHAPFSLCPLSTYFHPILFPPFFFSHPEKGYSHESSGRAGGRGDSFCYYCEVRVKRDRRRRG